MKNLCHLPPQANPHTRDQKNSGKVTYFISKRRSKEGKDRETETETDRGREKFENTTCIFLVAEPSLLK
jgi:hypothetical protein